MVDELTTQRQLMHCLSGGWENLRVVPTGSPFCMGNIEFTDIQALRIAPSYQVDGYVILI